eukprot:scaffold18449_cov118-Isochrysis_galbana.AAC.1
MVSVRPGWSSADGRFPLVVGVVEYLAGLDFDVDFVLPFVVVEGNEEPGAVGPLVEGVGLGVDAGDARE